MKKILYISALFVCATLFACSEGYDKMILGKWTLDKSEIEDLNSFCEYQCRKSIEELDKSLRQIDMEIESAQPALKQTLEFRRDGILKQKSSIVVDSVRAEIEDNLKGLVGNFFIEFRTNKTFTISSLNDSISGSWSIKGDTISTLISGRPAEDIIIKQLSDNKLELYSSEIDDDGYELSTLMKFSK